ncbi:MAG: hypothetical protein WC475_02510 [Candidatus Paceibacterota bacterium]
MTIIQPSKNRNRLSPILLLIMVFLLAGFYIYEYNHMVGLNYRVKSLLKSITDAQTENSNLKSQYYQLIDPARLEELAESSGLILDQQPQYLGANF